MIAKVSAVSLFLLLILTFCRASSVVAEEGGKGRGKAKGHNKGDDEDRAPPPKRQKPDRKGSDDASEDSQRSEQPKSTQDTSASSPTSKEDRTTSQPNRDTPVTTPQETTPSAPTTSSVPSDTPPAATLPAPPIAPTPEGVASPPSTSMSSDGQVPIGWESWTQVRRDRWQSDFLSSMDTIGLHADARGLTTDEKERWAKTFKERAMKGEDLISTTKEISKAVRTSKSKEEVMRE